MIAEVTVIAVAGKYELGQGRCWNERGRCYEIVECNWKLELEQVGWQLQGHMSQVYMGLEGWCLHKARDMLGAEGSTKLQHGQVRGQDCKWQ